MAETAPGAHLDVLAAAPLPYHVHGEGQFQIGGGLYCASLLLGLASIGHRVRALASAPRPPRPVRPDEFGAGVEVDWFALDFITAANPPPPDYVEGERAKLEAALDEAIADRRPDLVLLGSEAQAWYGVEPCKERDLPTLLVSHGVPTAALPAGIYPPDATQALVAHLGGVDQIVTVAGHLEAILRDFGLTRVETITTGVDIHRFQPRARDPELLRSLGIEDGQFVVGSFSHHRPEKRLTDVVASAELVLRSAPHVVYVIAGDGPCRQEIAELIEAKGLSDSFRLTGELDHADVPAHLALADAVVLASEREGCSLLCLEAHAAGRALIVSDIPAGREAARGGETGLLFRLGDVADLAARTLELVNSDTLRARQAANGRAAVHDNSIERWIQSCSDALVHTARRAR